ncbi:MAG: iron-sulfur cluster assembly scaffold protein [Candidatus Bruticola sp.]
MEYSAKTLLHGEKPAHVGEIVGAHGHAQAENPVCGDTVEFWINLDAERKSVQQVVFKSFGCLAAAAASEALCELAQGRSVNVALALEEKDILEVLDGLPPTKQHGAALACEAFQEALNQAVCHQTSC